MAWSSDLVRTKNWGTETLTDSDLEGQFDLIINWVMAAFNATTGHSHTGAANHGPTISPATGLVIASQAAGDLLYASSSTVWARLAKGAAGKALVMNAGATAPTWDGYAVPSGVIVMWSGTIASIPTGWVLCNGSNGTPDLRNRFIVCADADDGGAAKSTITGSALQSHDTGLIPAHTHTVPTGNSASGSYAGEGSTSLATATTSSYGTGTKVIPVFYALAFIQKT